MPKTIDIPGLGRTEFPDSMSDDEMNSHVKALMQPDARDGWSATKDAVGDFAKGAGEQLNPVTMLKGARDLAAGLMYHPIDTGRALLNRQGVPLANAQRDFHEGSYATGALHALNYLLPIVGPSIDEMQEDARKGNIAHAAGSAVGFGLANALPGSDLADAALSKIPDVPLTPKIVNPNVKEASAIQYLEDKGVPPNAAARTGNSYVKGVQKLADSSPIGSVVASRAEAATTEALKTEAGDLVNRATPDIPSDVHYANFRAAEADPMNMRTVQTGTKQTPVLNAQGNPWPGKMQTVPVTEDMPLPVAVGSLKPTLQPIFDEMQWMPAADRNASAGYRALENILKGPDYVPASVAETGLGGIKALAREGTGRSAGMAKFITPQLQDLIDGAVAKAGPDAVDALQQGRKSAAAEFGVDWLKKAFDTAQAEGGFNKQARLWADWERLGADQKSRIFKNPMLIGDLDKFFLGAKKLAENPNPSGSGLIGHISGSTSLAVLHPTTGIPYLLGSGLLAKMLHSPAGVDALTQGVKASSVGNKVASSIAAARILKLAGNAAQPMQFPQAAQTNDPSQQTANPELLANR